MGAQPTPDRGQDPEPKQENDPSEEVAESTAHLHFEGRGLNPDIETRYDDD